MKIRKGFVSNSSSSSFCIYGVELDFEEMEEYMKNMGITMDEMEEGDGDLGYWLQEFGYNKFPGLTTYSCSDSERCYIGRQWSYIGGEETGNEFKADVEKKLKECLGEEFECHTIDETIYN